MAEAELARSLLLLRLSPIAHRGAVRVRRLVNRLWGHRTAPGKPALRVRVCP